jgi:hypothetical protein
MTRITPGAMNMPLSILMFEMSMLLITSSSAVLMEFTGQSQQCTENCSVMTAAASVGGSIACCNALPVKC